MELVILLIVALLGGLLLGPIGFFKSIAVSNKLAKLERELDRLHVDLNGLRTVCYKLRTDFRDIRQTNSTEIKTEADEKPKQAPAQVLPSPTEKLEPITEEPAADQPPTTLERLREVREQHQANEQRKEQAEQPGEPLTADQPESEQPDPTIEKPKPIVEKLAAIEPADNPTSTVPPETHFHMNEHDAAPKRRLTIEEVLAGKVFVWIGAIALVLTAAFLLKLGFDSGIITEPVRVMAAAVFGIVLWGVGEWARSRVGLISQALCGAAVAVLFASVLAGHNLYGLFGPSGEAIAFGLMATITAAAILLSLRHGPAVAILGMLGGFMLPPVLNHGFGGPSGGMVLYLIAIEVGVLAVTGKRGWFGISLMTLIFSIAWSLGYTLIGDNPTERTLTAMLILGTAGAYLFHTARIHRDPSASPGTRKRVLGMSIAATCSAIGIIALLAVRGDYSGQDLGMLGLVAAGTLILARLDARQLAMPFVAMGLCLLVLLSNALRMLDAPPTESFITMSACFGGLFMIGGYACLWGSAHRRVFAVMCAVAGPAFYGLVVFAGHDVFGLREAWWPYTLGLAGLYALATVPMILRRKSEYDWPIALFAVLSFALMCVTLGQALSHPYFAVCLAIASAGAALIDLRLYIRPLRVAACMVAFVSAGLLIAPGPFDLTIHGKAVFNTLLPMYALPALSFGIIAWCAARAGSKGTARHLTWLCIATLTAMLLVLTRQAYQPADFIAQTFNLYEWSTYASVLLLAACVAHAIASRFKYPPILNATRCIVGIGAVVGLIAGLIPGNPLFNKDVVGGYELAMGLLALYLLPATLMWFWSRRQAITGYPQLAELLRVISITLLAIFVGLQIRNGFQSDNLHKLDLVMYEYITYAVAWLLLGGFIQRLNRKHLRSTATRAVGRVIFGLALATTLAGSVGIFNPLLDPKAVGGWGLVTPLAVLYMLPAFLMWLWSRGQTLSDQPRLTALLRGSAIAFLAIFVGQLIRNAFHHDDLHALTIGLFECTTYGLAWVALGALLHFISPRCTLPRTTGQVGRTIFGTGLLTLLIGNALVLNPLWVRETVGSMPVINGLWYLYGPTIAILALLASHARRHKQSIPAKLAGFMAIGLAFMLLSMFVRHGSSGDGLVVIAGNLASAERYAYSLAWVVFGALLLIAGVLTRLDTLRYGSLAILLLAVGKVFLIDTANLENLYRVFSFFGLGVTLIGLGYLYQRLVFRRPNPQHRIEAA